MTKFLTSILLLSLFLSCSNSNSYTLSSVSRAFLTLESTQKSTDTPEFKISGLFPGDTVILLQESSDSCEGGLPVADTASPVTDNLLLMTAANLGVSKEQYNYRARIIHYDKSESCTSSVSYEFNIAGEVHSTELGMSHGCTIETSTDKRYCWGYNGSGSVGNGDQEMQPTAVEIPSLESANSFALGNNFSCALMFSSEVMCWGENASGQLGLGTNSNELTPKLIPSFTGVKSISAGTSHACALKNDGTVMCWGDNSSGQLGTGDLVSSNTPVSVPLLTGVSSIVAGDSHTCAIIGIGNGNSVQCWGKNSDGQLGDLTLVDKTSPVIVDSLGSVSKISAKWNTSCALLLDGTIKCWGLGTSGQLGNSASLSSSSPVLVTGISAAIDLAISRDHGCAIIDTGAVYCWGDGYYNKLGNRREGIFNSPIVNPLVSTAKKIYAGMLFTCVEDLEDKLRCWGRIAGGAFGNGVQDYLMKPRSTFHSKDKKVLDIQAGTLHQCIKLDDGEAKCWGRSLSGGLGLPDLLFPELPTAPIDLGIVSNIKLGQSITCAIMPDKTVKCFGEGSYGQLGNGASLDSVTPVDVTLLSGVDEIAPGAFHNCARVGGLVKCWGYGAYVGNGSNTTINTPDDVSGITTAVHIASGVYHSCAVVDSARNVKCWGQGTRGEIGGGAYVSSNIPLDVTGVTNVKQLALGRYTSCALIEDGTVKCWGEGATGQLGDGTFTTKTFTPTDVIGLNNVIQISASRATFCALLSDKTVKCWGLGSTGRLGDGLELDSNIPKLVDGLTNIKSISVGGNISIALQENGLVKTWGYGSSVNNSTQSPSLGTLLLK